MTSVSSLSPPHIIMKSHRIESIDFLRGLVMIIMALDHVRDYFHKDAFYFSPTDLSQTSVILFFTRWITHFCAPVFVFLAGTSAYLYGIRKGKKELTYFLLTRGIWLVFVELFIVGLFRTFNPLFPYFNLQVIWATGISMIALSALIHLRWHFILLSAVALITMHNLFDTVHISGNHPAAVLWSVLHDVNHFTFGHFQIHIHYPVLPWIGIMGAGYCLGILYKPEFSSTIRRKLLLKSGLLAVVLFIVLRLNNWYGDANHWSIQKNIAFSLLSFLNVTKYPPSLLYILATLGPALIFLSATENPLKKWKERIVTLGKVPMFYYLLHILLIHLLALIGALIDGYRINDMILSTRVNDDPHLKGYGFSLIIVYLIWVVLIFLLYPFCKAFSQYKATKQSQLPWLSYL